MDNNLEILCYGAKEGMLGTMRVIEYYFTVNKVPIRSILYMNDDDRDYGELLQEACTYTCFHFMHGRMG